MPNIDIKHLLNTRFGDAEEVFLPALSVGGDDYAS
jgi:hypothetical protein